LENKYIDKIMFFFDIGFNIKKYHKVIKQKNTIYVPNEEKMACDVEGEMIEYSNYEYIDNEEIEQNKSDVDKILSNIFLGLLFNENYTDELAIFLGSIGIPVITNIKTETPNAIYVETVEEAIYYINHVYKNYWRFARRISSSIRKYVNGENRDFIVCYMPIWGRHDILDMALESCFDQDMEHRLICVVSCEEDLKYVKNKNKNKTLDKKMEYIYVENQPLGQKYQLSVEFCKIYYPYGVIRLGSDDILTKNYVSNIVKYIRDYDIIGKKDWLIYDGPNDTLEKFIYNHKLSNDGYWGKTNNFLKVYKYNKVGITKEMSPDIPFVIGTGRCLSYRLLNKVDWKVYPIQRRDALDTYSLFKLMCEGAKNITLSDKSFYIVSYKGAHNMINSLEKIKNSRNIIYESYENSELVDYIKILIDKYIE
jgi:hypothetical protein